MTPTPRSRRHRLLLPVLALPLALLVAASATQAGKKVFRWVDAQGNVHYGDSSGNAPASATQLEINQPPPDPGSLADLQLVRTGAVTEVFVENRIAAPLQVTLAFTASQNVRAEPGFPLHTVLPAASRVRVGTIEAANPGLVSSFSLDMTALPGDPSASAQDVAYSLPVDENSTWRLGQAFHGGYSHSDEQNLYAIDLVVPEGTPVLAARGGVVMQVESGFDKNGSNRAKYAQRANLIRILHDDGSMGLYAHLQENGVYVRVGDRVSVGQQIAASGNTGYSSGPHLHFAVQVNRGMRLASVPFRMIGPSGFLGLQ
jgi:murein DD-endopeptidase MepM/ murein hydrolase activator NlpD